MTSVRSTLPCPTTKPWHLTIATDGRHPLFDDEAARRAAVRVLARIAPDDLALFCFVDDHAHVVALGEAPRIGTLARTLVLGLRPIASAHVEPARVRPVESRSHMESLVKYVLTQPSRHGVDADPARWTGSCFQDLVGARDVGLKLKLSKALPRLRLRHVQEVVGLPATPIAPADDAAVRSAGIGRLVAAAAVALSVDPSLAGNTAPVVSARRAVAQLARAVGIPASEVAFALRVSERAARRLLSPELPTATIRLRLGLEFALDARSGVR